MLITSRQLQDINVYRIYMYIHVYNAYLQWCCEEIFHTPTLTFLKKILPPFYPDPVQYSGLALNLSA